MRTEERTRPVRVMLVEDNPGVRRALAALLNAAGDLQVCGEAATVAAAGPTVEASSPDVVIVDLRLPDGSGVQAAREVRARHPEIRLLLLTSAAEDEALVAAMLAGASGFLVKQLLGTDLVGAVRAVAAGRTLIDAAAGAAALERLGDPSTASGPDDARILALVVQDRTDAQISHDLGLDAALVRTRVASMASRLGAGRARRRLSPQPGQGAGRGSLVPGPVPRVPAT